MVYGDALKRQAIIALGWCTMLGASTACAQSVGLFALAASGSLQAGTDPIAIATGDFNGDGHADLAIANEYTSNFRGGGSITIFLNDGNGGFVAAAGSPIAVAFSPQVIIAGDFNNDGNVDLTLSNNGFTGNSGQISIFLGDGKGGFSQASGFPFSVGAGPFSMAAADFNHDGNLDIAIGLFRSNQVQVLMGNGEAAFVSSTFSTGAGPRAVVAGDFNGDGNPDLAVANFTSNDVTVLLGDGAGSFVPAQGSPFAAASPSNNPSPIAIAAGDFNEDGHADLAIVNSGVNSLSILVGDGTGAFSPGRANPIATGNSPSWVAAVDLNGDGHLDLAIANANSNTVTVLTGDGTGVFSGAPGGPFAVGAGPQALVVADFNGDGRPDIAAINYTSQIVSELVNQGCTMSVQPTSLTVDGASVDTSLSVIAQNPSACAWSGSTNATWITLGSSSGTNSGYEIVSLSANATGGPRTGIIEIAGISITVTQMATVRQFTDVGPTDYFFDAVDLLKSQAITQGCSASGYCPSEGVTRAQMAVFLIASILGPNAAAGPPFPFFNDVQPGSFGFNQIQQLFALGITAGCGSGDFCPDEVVTRAQMAVLLIRARYGSGAQFTSPQTPYFTDVPPNGFGYAYIQRMRQDGITSGCATTLFCPNNPVLRGDMALFLERGMFNHLLPPGVAYVASIDTKQLSAGTTGDISVTGVSTNFAFGATVVNPIPGIQVNSINVTSPTTLTVNVTAGSTATIQPESFWVTTGTEDAVLPAVISVQ